MPGANSKAQSQTWRSHSSPLAIPRAGEFIDLLVASKVGLVAYSDFSATFTTIAFDNSSLRWLEINT
jgi:hypothetical protein